MLSQQQMADLSRDAPFDPKVMGGSIKRKIVNPALIEERAKCSFEAACPASSWRFRR